MSTQLHKISNVQQLLKLYTAGGGEFLFFNKYNQEVFFKVSMRRAFRFGNTKNVSFVKVCFAKRFDKGNFVELGKWNRVTNTFQINSYSANNEKGFSILAKYFNYITSKILTGNDFFKEYDVYHTDKCCRCGKILQDADSLEAGIGANCVKKLAREQEIQLRLF